MRLIVDTNIVMAALLREGNSRKLLFSKDGDYCSPQRLEVELEKHWKYILEKSKLEPSLFEQSADLVLQRIRIVGLEEYEPFEDRARLLCPPGHTDDWPFLASALKLNCGLWSEDKALKKQGQVLVFSTTDLVRLLL